MKTFKARAFFAVILVMAMLAMEGEAQAYFDPGTGSLLLQAMAAGLMGAAVFWRRIRDKLRNLFMRKKDES